MASQEWTKRILRLVGDIKDTREPRGPEHMAKMKAARAPYSDPRDTHIASMIRYAFEYLRSISAEMASKHQYRRYNRGDMPVT